MAGHVFRFGSKPPASRHGGLTSLCVVMATCAKKPKQPTFNLNGRACLSFRFEAASIAPRRIDEFMWCDGNMRQKTQTANLQLEWPGMSFVSLRSRQHRATAD